MTSYSNGIWSFSHADCPTCAVTRRKQGFQVSGDGLDCPRCQEDKHIQAYVASEPYQTWLATRPEGMTMEEAKEWYTTHPAPAQPEFVLVLPPVPEVVEPVPLPDGYSPFSS